MSEFNWRQFWVVAIAFLVVGGLGAYFLLPSGGSNGFDQAYVNSAIANASTAKDAQIADLTAQLASAGNQTSSGGTGSTGSGTVTVIKETGGYLIDNIALESSFGKTLTDREISLFDGTVDWEGDSYDADEIFVISNTAKIQTNENDFEGKDYLVLPTDSLLYKVNFESTLLNTDVGLEDNDTLVFDFLGKEVEILNWDANSITLLSGQNYFMTEGQSVTVEGMNVTLDYVTEDYAYVLVGGVAGKVNEGQTKAINGLEVRAQSLFYRSNAESKAELKIAKKVKTVIDNGDEYTTNSSWVWTIDDNSIGLTLGEDYTDLDDVFSPLAPGKEVCLPNNYVCVKYNGLADVGREEYTFDYVVDAGDDYIVAKGDFVVGTTDYTKVFIRAEGIADVGKIYKESSLTTEITDPINLAGSGLILDTTATDIIVEDFTVKLDMSAVSGVDVHDYDQMTDYGILVEGFELTDKFFTISVPEESVTGSITLKDVNFKATTSETTTNSTAS